MIRKLQRSILLAIVVVFAITKSNAQYTTTFETFPLQPNSYWNGSSTPNGTSFTDGDVVFPNYYDSSFGGFWASGWAYSNLQDSTSAGFPNLYSDFPATGYNVSANYAIGQQNSIIKFNNPGSHPQGIYITNSTISALSMRDGDAFAKKFGGVTGNDPDWFKLTIRSYTGGNLTNDSVEYYLADFRFANNAQDYISKSWEWVNLTSLINSDSLLFTLSSSDVGAFGINTPLFFCIDNFTFNDPLAVNEIVNNSSIDLFPNPAKDNISIRVNSNPANASDIKITDATGKFMYEINSKQSLITIPIDEFSNGIYNVQITGNNFTRSKRFIKQ